MAQGRSRPGPLVGITGPRLQAAEVRSTPGILLGADIDSHYAYYPVAVARAGGMPVHLPRESDPSALVARLDALVVAGGQDVDPRSFGQQPTAMTSRLDPVRDDFEASLILAAIERDIPLLGICRGAQLLNVALGGSLVLDLVAQQEIEHARWIYPPELRTHDVVCRPGSLASAIYGEEVRVNSFHHQAIGELGTGIAVSATATDDTIEAIEVEGVRAIGVQWHPEMLADPDLIFDWLVRGSTSDETPGGRLERSILNEHYCQAAATRRCRAAPWEGRACNRGGLGDRPRDCAAPG